MDAIQVQKLKDAGVNTDAALSNFMNMLPMYEKFLNKFLADPTMASLVQTMADGKFQEAHLPAHSLKGITATLGLTKLNVLVTAEEQALKKGEFENAQKYHPQVLAEYDRIKTLIGSL